jgi:hypothetical protein
VNTNGQTAYNADSAQYKKTLNASVRDSWVKKTESLNPDRDGYIYREAMETCYEVLNNEDL